jgi:hypothetical protein
MRDGAIYHLGRIPKWLCAFTVLVTTASCQSSMATALSESLGLGTVVLDRDGTWVGKTNQAGATTPTRKVDAAYFSLTVSNSRVESVEFQFIFDAPCGGNLTASSSLGALHSRSQ